ncbi:MAG: hypothetical protein K9J74_05030 [Sulfuritalea sp.]|nr:hypothetical protein [Sulfuritalea sp.]
MNQVAGFLGSNGRHEIVKSMLPASIIFRVAKLCSVLALSTMLLPISAPAQTNHERIGTLFYSPQERVAIVHTRSIEAPDAAKGEFGEGKKGGAGSGKSVAVSGLVKRNRGKGTAWINGKTVAEGQAVPAAGIPVISPKSVIFDGQSVRVRETLDLESGARTDALPPGAVSVKPAK